MCRNENHGGRRCPGDTSERRRYRVKANKTRAEYADLTPLTAIPSNSIASYSSEESSKTFAEKIKKDIYRSVPSEASDNKLVEQLIVLGEKIATDAENQAGINLNAPDEEYQRNISEGMEESKASRIRLLAHRANREQLKESYITALSQVRDLGGKVSTLSESSEATQILSNTIEKHYPSDWIEQSNSYHSFTTRISTEPAYSRERTTAEDEEGFISDRLLPAVYTFSTAEEAEKFATNFDASNTEMVTVSDGINLTFQLSVKYEPSKIYDPSTDGPLMGGRPIGKEWTKKVSPLTLATSQYQNAKSETERLKIMSEPRWVKPVEVYHKRVLNIISENDPDIQHLDDKKSAVEAIAYHEFGHRMEEVLPDNALPRMEEAFIRTRTGKKSSEFRENMLKEAHNNYLYHNAGFVDKYAGRDYLNGNYEVFTVGVEALLGKNYGSLSGQHGFYTEEDRSHKAFILGVLATL